MIDRFQLEKPIAAGEIMEIVICIDCGWFGYFSDLLSEDGIPDANYEFCPDCAGDDVYEFNSTEDLKKLLVGKGGEIRRKVLDRVKREHWRVKRYGIE